MCAYDATKPVTGGSLVAADIRENFRALKDDGLVAVSTAQIADGSITEAKLLAPTVGDTVNCRYDPERGTKETANLLRKGFSVLKAGAFRIKFDLRSESAGQTAYGSVYRNGVLVGSEQSVSGLTYATRSQDIAGWVAGDQMEIYWKTSSATYFAYIRNIRIGTAVACLGVA
ncbi:MAG: hypothetical protein Q7J85_07130 [Bacillota bacterium]|nr:hypothetical protein [Bacillota bacterium]